MVADGVPTQEWKRRRKKGEPGSKRKVVKLPAPAGGLRDRELPRWALEAPDTCGASSRHGGGPRPQLQSWGSSSPSRGLIGWPGFSPIQFFMILCCENCQKPIVFLTAVLTWGAGWGWQEAFIIHWTKLLQPNSTTKESRLLSLEASLIVKELVS